MIRLLVLAVVLALTACGKVGAPTPPGPQADIIYPRLPYPAQ